MIYYSLSVLILVGIRDILIISTPRDTTLFQEFFEEDKHLRLNIQYVVKEHQNGLAEAFIIGEEFIRDDKVALVLGDNIFDGYGLYERLYKSVERE